MTVTFAVPAVVRLRYMVRVPFNSHVPLSRRAVLVRDGRVTGVELADGTIVPYLNFTWTASTS